MSWRYASNIVPAAISINNPIQNAALKCNRIKEKYLSSWTKYSVAKYIWRAWETFIGKTSEVLNKNSAAIGASTPQTPNTKELSKVTRIIFCRIISYNIAVH